MARDSSGRVLTSRAIHAVEVIQKNYRIHLLKRHGIQRKGYLPLSEGWKKLLHDLRDLNNASNMHHLQGVGAIRFRTSTSFDENEEIELFRSKDAELFVPQRKFSSNPATAPSTRTPNPSAGTRSQHQAGSSARERDLANQRENGMVLRRPSYDSIPSYTSSAHNASSHVRLHEAAAGSHALDEAIFSRVSSTDGGGDSSHGESGGRKSEGSSLSQYVQAVEKALAGGGPLPPPPLRVTDAAPRSPAAATRATTLLNHHDGEEVDHRYNSASRNHVNRRTTPRPASTRSHSRSPPRHFPFTIDGSASGDSLSLNEAWGLEGQSSSEDSWEEDNPISLRAVRGHGHERGDNSTTPERHIRDERRADGANENGKEFSM